MLLDHHVHTQFASDAPIDAFKVAERAHGLGLSHLGFAENFPLPKPFAESVDDESHMVEDDLPHYFDTISAVRAEFAERGLNVLLGVEADFVPAYHDQIGKALFSASSNLDFVVLGNHFLGDLSVTLSQATFTDGCKERFGRDAKDGPYTEYYGVLRHAVETGWFDVVGHLDMIKKFDERSGAELAELFRPEICDVLDAMAKVRVALELNTSGFDLYCHEQFPAEPILRWALQRGIKLTLASDAHADSQTGRHFDRALEVLQRLGVTELAYFQNHQMHLRPIPTAQPPR